MEVASQPPEHEAHTQAPRLHSQQASSEPQRTPLHKISSTLESTNQDMSQGHGRVNEGPRHEVVEEDTTDDDDTGSWTGNTDLRENVDVKSEASDSASIHHDGEVGDDSQSMIQVQAEPTTAIMVIDRLIPPDSQSLMVRNFMEAPAQVRAVVNKWWDAHGRRLPPCAATIRVESLTKAQGPNIATWLDKSGELLTPELFEIQVNSTDKRPYKRMLVVQGPKTGSRLIYYHKIGGNVSGFNGVWYRVWNGVDGTGDSGFETSPSVWKGYMAKKDVERRTLKLICAELFASLPPLNPSMADTTSGAPRTARKTIVSSERQAPQGLNPNLPTSIDQKLRGWFAAGRPSPPPCSAYLTDSTEGIGDVGGATFWHVSGVKLRCQAVALIQGQNSAAHKRLLVATGAQFGLGPLLIRAFAQHGKSVYAYKFWKGLTGNDAGFEDNCSVFKIMGSHTTSAAELKEFARSMVGRQPKAQPKARATKDSTTTNPTNKSTSARQSLTDDAQPYQPPRSAKDRSSLPAMSNTAGLERRKRRRTDLEVEEDESTLLNRFLTPAAESIGVEHTMRPPSTIPSSKSISTDRLQRHIKNNSVLLFYPWQGDVPRIRLLASCDTVEKLFAQATAGDVFREGSNSATKVIAVTPRAGHNKTMNMVENDQEDFEDFFSGLQTLQGCWGVTTTGYQGSLTIEVRAKQ